MDSSKILTADLLDLVFDDRNKSYGAYELRRSYNKRIGKALIMTGCIAAVVIGTTVFANSGNGKEKEAIHITSVDLTAIEEEKPVKIEEPEIKKQEPEPTKTEIYVAPTIVPDDQVEKPMTTQDDLQTAIIDIKQSDGKDDDRIATPGEIDGNTNIIVAKKPAEPEIWTDIQVQAKFSGNWERFLTRNLNAEVPIDNGAPAGQYKVIIQFVVDVDGTVSDIKPLTSHGYGLEEEAIRVLRKADKWEAGIQNGYKVKSYRKQPITFVVENN